MTLKTFTFVYINNLLEDKQKYSRWIKEEAIRLGFNACGVARVDYLTKQAPLLKKWLDNNMNGSMGYMANHQEKRINPELLLQGARSIIMVLLNYYPNETQQKTDAPKISKYAYGKDYHVVIKNKLHGLMDFISSNIGRGSFKAFADSAPVMEKAWAASAGLGWIGKNSLLINKQLGSFVFIGGLLLDIELEYDDPLTGDICGNCTKCMEACPTKAIIAPRTVDARKCIAYLTIEVKGEIPESAKGKMGGWAYGCDTCQDACPWNSKLSPHNEAAFLPQPDLLQFTKNDWVDLSEGKFNELFKGSPVERVKYEGFMRNVRSLEGN